MRELIGSVLSTIVSFLASSCCIGPTLFVVFGISTGGLSSLSFLEPYRWHLLAVGYAGIGYSFYRLYLKNKKVECACQEPALFNKLSKALSWFSLLLLVFATFYPYILAKLYGG